METKYFDYPLPENLIAQEPLEQRDASRLLIADATLRTVAHSRFASLPEILRTKLTKAQEPVLLVFNNSRVFPARVRIRRKTGARGEILLLEDGERASYRCLLRPQKKIKPGEELLADDDSGTPLFRMLKHDPCEVERVNPNEPLSTLLERHGEMPLPPYIVRDPLRVGTAHKENDRERYQTVYSEPTGSVAAPTAGLHFTEKVLSDCRHAGCDFAYVTLHVGLGTFLPVQAEDIENHVMHEEHYCVPFETAKKLALYVKKGWPIVFVGTTSLRTVESFLRHVFKNNQYKTMNLREHIRSISEQGELETRLCAEAASWHSTQLFIRPRHKDERVLPAVGNALLTNFHQPQSTLAMLVAALLGYDFWKEAYQHALDSQYRFLSYGDSSLLIFANTEKVCCPNDI